MNGVKAIEAVLSELRKDEQNYDDWPEDIEEAAYIVALWAKRMVGSAGDIKYHDAPVFPMKRSAAKVGALAIRLLMNLDEGNEPQIDDES